jgi:DNA-binding IclR family transcriptional regulator
MVDILDCFTAQQSSLQLAEIAGMSRLDRSTALRLLRALEGERLVRRDPQSKRYALGAKLVQWGALALDSLDLRAIADPILRCLNTATHETVALFLRDGDRRVCVMTYESPHLIRHVLPVGTQLRITQAAGGRAALAALPPDEAAALIDADTLLTECERRAIHEDLPLIRARGYAFGDRLMTPNAWSLAAPIFDRNAAAIATLVVSGPDNRIDAAVVEQYVRHLLPAAAELSRALGAPAELCGAAVRAHAR